MRVDGKLNDKLNMILGQNERDRRIALTAITSAFSRVLAIIVPLLVVRIAIQNLGTETYGLWMTVTAFFTLFTFADLGLGSGLQTKLSRLYGHENNKEAQRLISSTFFVVTVVAFAILTLFSLIFSSVDWVKLMNAESDQTVAIVGTVVLAVLLSRIANIPLGIIQRVQFAFQEGHISNLWNCAASLLSLLLVYILANLSIEPVWIIWGSSLAPIIIAALNHYVYFYIQHPEFKPKLLFFCKEEAYAISKIGLGFMTLSILTTFGLTMDSYIIAKTSNLENVTYYSICFRISTVIGVATTMLSTPLWSANGEALAKNDFSWIKKTTKKISIISISITMLGSFLVLLFGNKLINVWLGGNFTIPLLLISGLLLMQISQAFISPYFMVLNGAGIIKKQIILFSIYTPISLVLKYILSLHFSYLIVPWVGTVLYAIFIVIPVFVISRNIYNRKNILIKKCNKE